MIGIPTDQYSARDILLDTGPLVATLDAADQWHAECAPLVTDFARRCITTEAVVTEASYLVMRGGARGSLVLDFLHDAEIPVLTLPEEVLPHLARLMDQYHDLPMDFADATLVAWAEVVGTRNVLTVDRRGFRTYRLKGRKTFRLYPEPLV